MNRADLFAPLFMLALVLSIAATVVAHTPMALVIGWPILAAAVLRIAR